ncbi:MAG: isopenicillin N synthase family oxygenase [Actinobacteria bacterium]|nr:isopenicillin N synthase family oxygenase [Actinomycetota bacterium]
MSFHEIPVVSLAGWTESQDAGTDFADGLRSICHEIGFFRLVDHGVDPTFVADYFGAIRAFFALPEETKAQIDKVRSPWFRGWERVGAELTDNRVDHREQIDVWTELDPRPRDVEPAYLRLEGPNQWPDDTVVPGFRRLVERFQTEMGAIADQLMAAMCVGLGLPADHLHRVFGERPMSLVKLIHYPPTPAGEAGVNAHHDTGFLTLLWQHGVPGLQVQNRDGDWIDVPADGDAIIVNLGEMLQSMTGNYFVATTHRVIASVERYSSGYFHGPDLTTPLDPLPLGERYARAVAASAHHREAGFMARRDELLSGLRGTGSAPADTYGQQLWNYFTRSYPDLVRRHHADVAPGG